ncbi:hypothetical protein AGMMS49944_02540 [Spirochaetia bacterium]|nr:hypothetical protein AGMMS49944_02540 [Spirochaetia bacterium]
MDMHTYKVQPIAGNPDWDAIEKTELTHALWLPRPDGMRAFGQLCYNQDALKVRLTAHEKNPLARSLGLTDYVHIDSALEFFFSPLPDDPRYFNFEFNLRGTIYLGFGFDRYRAARQLIPDYRSLFSVTPFQFDGGWGIDFVIPVSFIGIYLPSFKLEKGLVLRGNFYKCGEETEPPHYLAWNPVEWETPEFHRPECFGQFRLE